MESATKQKSGIEPQFDSSNEDYQTASHEAVSLLHEYMGETLPDAENLARTRKGRVWVQRLLREESRSSLLPLSDALKELDPDTQSLISLYSPGYTGLTIVGFPRFDHIYSAVSSAFPYHVSYEGFGSDLANVLNSADYSLCINTQGSQVVRSGPTTNATIGIQLEPTWELTEERGAILQRLQTMLSDRYLIKNPGRFIDRHIFCGVPLESRLGTHIPIGCIKQRPDSPRYTDSLSLIGGIIRSNLPEKIHLEPVTIANLPAVSKPETANEKVKNEHGEQDMYFKALDTDTFGMARELAIRGLNAAIRSGGQVIISTPHATELQKDSSLTHGNFHVVPGKSTYLHIKH